MEKNKAHFKTCLSLYHRQNPQKNSVLGSVIDKAHIKIALGLLIQEIGKSPKKII
jgi:hypothetical protein